MLIFFFGESSKLIVLVGSSTAAAAAAAVRCDLVFLATHVAPPRESNLTNGRPNSRQEYCMHDILL